MIRSRKQLALRCNLDYRLEENRKESFVRWMSWSLQYKDCDPAVWLTNYLHKRYEHNDEQRLWLAWLYGNTYYLPTAWILLNEFPDYELATVDRMEKWNGENYKRLRYQTDTKWNKGHLPSMFESYQRFIGDVSQRQRIDSYLGENPTQTFDNLWASVKGNLHKFGRYSTWFYLQHLRHTAGVDMEPSSLMLDDYSGSRSHRNGLLLAIGRDSDYDRKLDSKDYESLEGHAREILQEVRIRNPNLAHEADFFTMETCLCSYKKIFREHHGRYLGYYLDRAADEIKKVEDDGWYGIDWDVLWQARNETLDLRLDTKQGIMKEKFSYFVNTGGIDRLEWMYDDEFIEPQGLEAFV